MNNIDAVQFYTAYKLQLVYYLIPMLVKILQHSGMLSINQNYQGMPLYKLVIKHNAVAVVLHNDTNYSWCEIHRDKC